MRFMFENKSSFFIIISLFFLQLLFVFCSGPKMFVIPPGPPDDKTNVPEPASSEINSYAEYFDKQLILQLDESTDLSRQIRNITDNRKQALNCDAFGQVANSSWFTNRMGQAALSLEEIARGPNKSNGPNTSDTWIITRAKAQGVTPGFSIKDINGEGYVIKFDPPDYGELASGAEVVSTKLFYAAGYNTPQNFVVYFNPKILKMGEKVRFTDHKGRKRYMNDQDLKELLTRVEIGENGLIRALASKYISGSILGPFRYKGVRKDDLNDVIPHQHRRELRGLRLFAAWLNHFDTKDGNSLDAFVSENGKSYVKHFLIDFGATLGSASHSPNSVWRGHEYDFDPKAMLTNVASMGVYVRPWEKQEGVVYPSIGFYESELFHPMKYKPQVPNPAFENMTTADAYWATHIIMSFTDEHIKTAVKQGHYTNKEAAEYLAKTLIKRRDKIVRYWFDKMPPLDDFTLDQTGNHPVIRFRDLGTESSLYKNETTAYQYCVTVLPEQNVVLSPQQIGNSTRIHFMEKINKKSIQNGLQLKLAIQLKRNHQAEWSLPVNLYLSRGENEKYELIGIEREN
jgi:hypothetical protein